MRKFINVAICVLLLATPSFAVPVLQSVDIPDADSLFVAQSQTNWCWAACNVMLLKGAGIPETQEKQVFKMFGKLVNQGAGTDYRSAATALSGSYTKADRTRLVVVPYVSYLAQRNPTDPVMVIESLRQGIPVAMATPAHGFVCVGVDYLVETLPTGVLYQITKLRLLDPAHGLFPVPKNRVVTMDQFINEGLIGFMSLQVR